METFKFTSNGNFTGRETAIVENKNWKITIAGSNNQYTVWRGLKGIEMTKVHPVNHYYTKEKAVLKAEQILKIANQN